MPHLSPLNWFSTMLTVMIGLMLTLTMLWWSKDMNYSLIKTPKIMKSTFTLPW